MRKQQYAKLFAWWTTGTDFAEHALADAIHDLLDDFCDPIFAQSSDHGKKTKVKLSKDDDVFVAPDYVDKLKAGKGDDDVTLEDGGHRISLGKGDDILNVSGHMDKADGGKGYDVAVFDVDAGLFDISVRGNTTILLDRFSGAETVLKGFEEFRFADRSFTKDQVATLFDHGNPMPTIQVGGSTQTLTVNQVDPTVSVVWDRVVQQAVIDGDMPIGPTLASRAYAMVHTAIYDAWSSYDPKAVRVSHDIEGDNVETRGKEADMEKAMSFAALTVLRALFPEQEALYEATMTGRYGFAMHDDGSLAARIGIDAAEDLLALRAEDGWDAVSNYAPVNPSPAEVYDIARWTPDNVPVDPEDDSPEQKFLTPQWGGVESFALLKDNAGNTDFSATLPPPPKGFFAAGYEDSILNFADKTITLGAATTIGDQGYAAGDIIAVGKDLIGKVINPGFIAQAEHVVNISAHLTDEQKIIAEFWEDGGKTAFPPGTFMSFAHFVSARDGHGLAEDAKLFLAMGNAVMDAGIATWHSKVEYDYARPIRVIRDLGELGLIGEWGIDEMTGEEGYVVQAFGGVDPVTGMGVGTRTILAENFVTFQRPGADASPPFAEYTSGHSAFSAAGAEVLRLFTGSDDFGGRVTFDPDSIQFERNIPHETVTLAWDTFSAAADEAGISRLYGGIHFEDGDMNGRALGRTVGADAFAMAQTFIDGTASETDRPFAEDFLFA